MKNNDLYRKESLNRNSTKLDGEVIIAQPVTMSLLTICLTVAVLIVITFVATATYDRKESVRGYLKPQEGLSRVHVPRAGTLKEIYVKDGEAVEQGQPLILVRTEENIAGGGSLGQLLDDSFIQQINLLEAQKVQVESGSDFQLGELNCQVEFYHSLMALLIKSVPRVKLPLSHLGLTHHFAHGHAKAG